MQKRYLLFVFLTGISRRGVGARQGGKHCQTDRMLIWQAPWVGYRLPVERDTNLSEGGLYMTLKVG